MSLSLVIQYCRTTNYYAFASDMADVNALRIHMYSAGNTQVDTSQMLAVHKGTQKPHAS